MKAVEWSEWVRHRRATVGAVATVAGHAPPRRVLSRRARTPEEREMIVRGTVALMRNREREGRLMRLGQRRYRLRASGDGHGPIPSTRPANRPAPLPAPPRVSGNDRSH